jgi:signal transduction histidine kinase
MGLPLVRQTVEGAGGELKMYSPPDWGGVESVVSLPIHIVAATGEGSTKKGA